MCVMIHIPRHWDASIKQIVVHGQIFVVCVSATKFSSALKSDFLNKQTLICGDQLQRLM